MKDNKMFKPNPNSIRFCNGCQYLVISTSFIHHGGKNIQRQCQYSISENEFKATTLDECPIPKNIKLFMCDGKDNYMRPEQCLVLEIENKKV